MSLGHLWAGWRRAYIEGEAGVGDGCVFCRILASPLPDDQTYILWRGERCFAILNLFPYTSGHLLVMPIRHAPDLEDVSGEEAAELWSTLTDAVRALKAAYRPEGINIGANLGLPAGAGVPGHVHFHCMPRWVGDTNFMTTVAEVRVLPEALSSTYERLTVAWPR